MAKDFGKRMIQNLHNNNRSLLDFRLNPGIREFGNRQVLPCLGSTSVTVTFLALTVIVICWTHYCFEDYPDRYENTCTNYCDLHQRIASLFTLCVSILSTTFICYCSCKM